MSLLRKRICWAGIFLLVCVACLVGGCSDNQQGNYELLPAWLGIDQAAISDTLTVGEYVFVLDAHLNRDFMPPTSPDGGPLGVGVALREINEQEYDRPINEPTLYVVNGLVMWKAADPYLYPDHYPSYERYFSAGFGPKWGPGVLVDVVFQFRDEFDVIWRIIAHGVNIDEWTSPGFVDTQRPLFEARSNASGLTLPI